MSDSAYGVTGMTIVEQPGGDIAEFKAAMEKMYVTSSSYSRHGDENPKQNSKKKKSSDCLCGLQYVLSLCMSASSVVSATISTQQTHYSITTSGLEMNDTGTFIAVWYSVIPLTGRDGSTTTNKSIDIIALYNGDILEEGSRGGNNHGGAVDGVGIVVEPSYVSRVWQDVKCMCFHPYEPVLCLLAISQGVTGRNMPGGGASLSNTLHLLSLREAGLRCIHSYDLSLTPLLTMWHASAFTRPMSFHSNRTEKGFVMVASTAGTTLNISPTPHSASLGRVGVAYKVHTGCTCRVHFDLSSSLPYYLTVQSTTKRSHVGSIMYDNNSNIIENVTHNQMMSDCTACCLYSGGSAASRVRIPVESYLESNDLLIQKKVRSALKYTKQALQTDKGKSKLGLGLGLDKQHQDEDGKNTGSDDESKSNKKGKLYLPASTVPLPVLYSLLPSLTYTHPRDHSMQGAIGEIQGTGAESHVPHAVQTVHSTVKREIEEKKKTSLPPVQLIYRIQRVDYATMYNKQQCKESSVNTNDIKEEEEEEKEDGGNDVGSSSISVCLGEVPSLCYGAYYHRLLLSVPPPTIESLLSDPGEITPSADTDKSPTRSPSRTPPRSAADPEVLDYGADLDAQSALAARAEAWLDLPQAYAGTIENASPSLLYALFTPRGAGEAFVMDESPHLSGSADLSRNVYQTEVYAQADPSRSESLSWYALLKGTYSMVSHHEGQMGPKSGSRSPYLQHQPGLRLLHYRAAPPPQGQASQCGRLYSQSCLAWRDAAFWHGPFSYRALRKVKAGAPKTYLIGIDQSGYRVSCIALSTSVDQPNHGVPVNGLNDEEEGNNSKIATHQNDHQHSGRELKAWSTQWPLSQVYTPPLLCYNVTVIVTQPTDIEASLSHASSLSVQSHQHEMNSRVDKDAVEANLNKGQWRSGDRQVLLVSTPGEVVPSYLDASVKHKENMFSKEMLAQLTRQRHSHGKSCGGNDDNDSTCGALLLLPLESVLTVCFLPESHHSLADIPPNLDVAEASRQTWVRSSKAQLIGKHPSTAPPPSLPCIRPSMILSPSEALDVLK